jgi:hypothetical protein
MGSSSPGNTTPCADRTRVRPRPEDELVDAHPLQVLELNRKDVTDVAALLTTYKLDERDEPGSINRRRIVEVLSTGWGFYTTATENLERIPGLVSEIDAELGRHVAAVAGELHEEVLQAPKSRAFNLRARVGRRKRWYEVPDESIT